MEELIFFGVLVALSLLDMLAKKVRKSQETEAGGAADDGTPQLELEEALERDWEREVERQRSKGRSEPPRAGGAQADSPMDASGRGAQSPWESSESMVPSDVWEEIGALARGERAEPKPQPQEPPSPPSPPSSWDTGVEEVRAAEAERALPPGSPVRTGEVGRGIPRRYWRKSEVGQEAIGEHPIHRSHAGYGTDPSERALPPLVAPSDRSAEEARAVRRTLRHGDPAELRRAFILQEVLGPPVALRDEEQ